MNAGTPHSDCLELERSLAGAILLDPGKVIPICQKYGLCSNDFQDISVQRVIDVTWTFFREGKAIDSVTIKGPTGLNGELDSMIDACTTVEHADYYARQISQSAQLRRIEIATKARDMDAVQRIVAEYTNQTKKRPSIVSATDFTATSITRPPEIIQGLLHKGSKGVYGGPSKAFKTWSLMHAGIAVSAGRRWFGFETALSRVLYINFELQDFACQERIKTIGGAIGVDDFSNLDVWNLRGHSVSLDKLIPELLKQIKGAGYGLIIPDPIYKTLQGRNELDAGDIGAVCNEIEHLAVETGAAVLFGAHYAKGNASGKEAIDRISGSGVWGRDPDSIITATRHELEGCFTVECICRNFPPPGPFCIRWNYPLMERDDSLDPAALKQAQAGRKPTWSIEDILGNLTGPLTTTEWLKRCQAESGITRATFFRLKSQAETNRIIEKRGEKWGKT